jgi:AraC family transcriptional regulator of adaptative response/methylated-DNA-[protein]-cysteine methyltransferase
MQTELMMLPAPDEMYDALVRKDTSYDGIFFTAVTSTGIFCRPSCPAKKPLRENVEFYASPKAAMAAGYRACRRCKPLEPAGTSPEWLKPFLDEMEAHPERRWTDEDLRARDLEPGRVRRWFKTQYGMTFHAYQRGMRLGKAMEQLRNGAPITRTAFDAGYDSLSGFNDAFRQLAGLSPSASRDAEAIMVTRVLTPLGPMIAGATAAALCLFEFMDQDRLERQLRAISRRLPGPLAPGRNAILDQVETELERYFDGDLRAFTIPLHTPGSDFQQAVWRVLREIPYGETRSYGEQARALGRPEAVRAVARANGDNRIAIIIPCHRVIGADGSLTGYGGGLWRKRWLLDLEQGRRTMSVRKTA